jgi:hypothetical protein
MTHERRRSRAFKQDDQIPEEPCMPIIRMTFQQPICFLVREEIND